MSVKSWLSTALFGLLVGANAGFVFSVIESRFVAALLAGVGFIVYGIYLLCYVWSDKTPHRWWTFYTAPIHLFLISLPMVGVRILNPDTHFEDLTVLWLAGPEFHRYSTFFYQLVLLGVIVDSVRFYFHTKKAAFR